MYFRSISILIFAMFSSMLWGQAEKFAGRPEISKETRMQLIRLVSAEYAFTQVPLPMGDKGLTLKSDGTLEPSGQGLARLIATRGAAARPGERVQISSIEIKDKSIVLEINGGPKKKKKWYQRIQIVGAGGATAQASDPSENAKGSSLTLEFRKHVPEMTLNDLKELLKPVFDFSVKSAAQAYVDTLPENVRNAIRDHKVLVGMNQEMVTYSKGRPPKRIREKDSAGTEYEEWIYGAPPETVEFVRFIGDEVVRVETMTVDGQKVVRTQREVNPPEGYSASTKPAPEAPASHPAKAPTLRRAGEQPPADPNAPPGNDPILLPPPPDKPQDNPVPRLQP
jgi:hypothetical protein